MRLPEHKEGRALVVPALRKNPKIGSMCRPRRPRAFCEVAYDYLWWKLLLSALHADLHVTM